MMLLKAGRYFSIVTATAMFNAVAVFAQSAPSSGGTAYTTSPQAAGLAPVGSAPGQLPIGLLVQRTNGSLLRAETYKQVDAGALTPCCASFYDVPEPKPKLLRKHDLVTIIIRENSQFTTN